MVQALYNSPSDPELFQRLLLALLTVSKSHPQNLIQLLNRDRLKEFCTAKRTPPPDDTKEEQEGEGKSETEPISATPDMEQDFLMKLNAVFWELIEQTPGTPAITSVATPGTYTPHGTCHNVHPLFYPHCTHHDGTSCVYCVYWLVMMFSTFFSPPGC